MKKMLGILAATTLAAHAQMAVGSPKFLGNITTNGAIRGDYLQYWNQITGENECKWGSVEGVRDQYNWTGCDRIYNYAKQKGIPTKFHTLVWGSQYPNWLMSLSTADQRAEITEWFDEAKKRYPDLDMIDVVNEAVPGHAPAPFKAALGGDGATGYDWIITSFKMARERWPKALLIYNDYNALTWQRAQFIDLLNRVKSSGYIDAAGLQSHGLEGFSGTQIKTYLEEIRNKVGLPIMISEYDIANADDNAQKNKIAEQFPIFWEADYVGGVTMWGYVNGSTWVPNTGLLRSNGTERPSMTWLKSYVASHKNVKSAVDFSIPGAPKFTNPFRKVSQLAVSTNIPVGGATRNMLAYSPQGLTAGKPLVISLHGLNQDAAYQQNATQWEKVADTAKFTLVYPNAINKSWDISGNNDIAFLQAIIDTMYRRNKIDLNRVYVTGFSMGGMMSYHAANRLGNKIAAIGPVSGYLFSGSASSSRPMPILHIHGDADNVVPYSGVSAMLGKWRTLDKCPTNPTVVKPYPSNVASSTASLQKWAPCDRSEVQLITLPGKGHWHSNDAAVVHSTRELWNFLKRWSLNSSSSSSSSATVSSSSRPSSSSVKVSSSSVSLSSSSKPSSSSAAVSSSSASNLKACIAFVNGVGGYGSNCYKSGLSNMAANTCYIMNPARGEAPPWINNNANDTWWWSKTSCAGMLRRLGARLESEVSPSSYQVYDLTGKLVRESAYEPKDLGAGRWIVVSRDALGHALSSRTVLIGQ